MSKPTISLAIANPQETFIFGERLKCNTIISVTDETKCNAVTLELLRRTHGKGNINERVFETVSLRNENLPIGNHSFETAFTIPSGPLSYHGTIVNIDWYIRATIDIPWAFDVREEIDFLVLNGSRKVSLNSLNSTKDFKTSSSTATENSSMLKVKRVITFFIFFAAFFVFAFNLKTLSNYIGVIIFPFVFFIFGAALFRPIKNIIAKRRFSLLDLSALKETLKPGEETEALLEITTKKNVHISGYKLSLVGKEIAVSGSGTSETTHHHVFFTQPVKTDSIGILHSGQTVMKRSNFSIPQNAPLSFSTYSNKIVWSLEAELAIERWPDWSSSREIKVI